MKRCDWYVILAAFLLGVFFCYHFTVTLPRKLMEEKLMENLKIEKLDE